MYPAFGHLQWITPYGVMLVVAFTSAWWVARRRAPSYDIDPSHIDLLVPVAFVAGIIGTRFVTHLLPFDGSLGHQQVPYRLRLFGLMATAAVVVYWYARWTGLNPRRTADLLATSGLLWIAVTRIGCYLAGCCWGDVAVLPTVSNEVPASQINTLPWLVDEQFPLLVQFPSSSFAFDQHAAFGLISEHANFSLPVHPTQLYESVSVAVVLLLLVAARRFGLREGITALGALFGYALSRFAIEFLRADNHIVAGHYTTHQLIAAAIVVGCIAYYQWQSRAPGTG